MDIPVSIDVARIIQLVDSEFQTRHPELKTRQIQFRAKASSAKDEALRAEWNEMFTFESMKAMRLASRALDAAKTKFDTGA